MTEPVTPLFFSIQHFCIHDGPGIRSNIFFKGCPLRCKWCQNPESWSTKPEMAFKHHLCIDCGICIDICPEHAISKPGCYNQKKCRQCLSCVKNCPTGAKTCFGKPYTVEQIMDELCPEYPFYRNSGGGVTFSGGEPTLFADFITKLAHQLHDDDISIALETCGLFNPKSIMDAEGSRPPSFLPKIDLVLFDIKLFSETRHTKYCAKGNATIKKNLKTLSRLTREGRGPMVWPRMPLIPGITDTQENLSDWAHFLRKIRLPFLTIVPYHNLGDSKRLWLSLKPAPDIPSITDDNIKNAIALLSSQGITCFAPGEEDWSMAEQIA